MRGKNDVAAAPGLTPARAAPYRLCDAGRPVRVRRPLIRRSERRRAGQRHVSHRAGVVRCAPRFIAHVDARLGPHPSSPHLACVPHPQTTSRRARRARRQPKRLLLRPRRSRSPRLSPPHRRPGRQRRSSRPPSPPRPAPRRPGALPSRVRAFPSWLGARPRPPQPRSPRCRRPSLRRRPRRLLRRELPRRSRPPSARLRRRSLRQRRSRGAPVPLVSPNRARIQAQTTSHIRGTSCTPIESR